MQGDILSSQSQRRNVKHIGIDKENYFTQLFISVIYLKKHFYSSDFKLNMKSFVCRLNAKLNKTADSGVLTRRPVLVSYW